MIVNIVDNDEVILGQIEGKAAEILAACAQTDEPIFVLRGQDIFSVMGMGGYLRIVGDFAPDDIEMQSSIVDEIAAFKHWQKNNMDKVRYPD